MEMRYPIHVVIATIYILDKQLSHDQTGFETYARAATMHKILSEECIYNCYVTNQVKTNRPNIWVSGYLGFKVILKMFQSYDYEEVQIVQMQ